MGAGVSLAVVRAYALVETRWSYEETGLLPRTKTSKNHQKFLKNVDAFFRFFLESSKLLIVFLDRSGLVLCRNKVSAISIGPSSRTFKIKNGATRVHLTHEKINFHILSMQFDRACHVTYTVRFSAL
jgi:hypothetical protein